MVLQATIIQQQQQLRTRPWQDNRWHCHSASRPIVRPRTPTWLPSRILLTHAYLSLSPSLDVYSLTSATSLQFRRKKIFKLEMWANAQRGGRPAEYRWRHLFNAAKFGWRSLIKCRAVTLPRHDTRWNMMGCPKPANRSQPLVGRSSPYCGDMWRRYRCLTSFFFRLSIRALVAKIWPDKVARWCPDGQFLATFLGPVFTAKRAQHVSDLHYKFALGPHHVSKYGRHSMCGSWD